MKTTLGQIDCRICCLRLSTTEDILNKQKPARSGYCNWWFCSEARTSAMCDENGVIVMYGKPCLRNYCFDCVQHNVSRIIRALHLVQPEGLVTINDVGQHHEDARARVRAFRRRLRARTGAKIEDLYVLERYVERDRDGLGLHMYVHGYLPDEREVLPAAWDAGMDPDRRPRAVHVDPMTHHGNLGYFFKHTESSASLKSFMDDNGGNLMSTSRGFWRLPGHLPARQGYRGLLRQARDVHGCPSPSGITRWAA